MDYTIGFFIKKYEATPEQVWITLYLNKNDKGCALWLCGMRGDGEPLNEEAKALISLLPDLISINDGYNRFYQQPTPKQRVLAAFYDLKAKQAVKEAEEIISQPQNVEV